MNRPGPQVAAVHGWIDIPVVDVGFSDRPISNFNISIDFHLCIEREMIPEVMEALGFIRTKGSNSIWTRLPAGVNK